jgi:S1-C subfamily serine protease
MELLSLICLAASIVGAQSAPPQKDIPTIAKDSNGEVVSIITSDKDGNPLAKGSGFLVSRDGSIVTNYHVVKNASSAIVKFPDGAFYEVEGMLAFDKDRDLAVIKARGENFHTVTLGNSDQCRVGEAVVAIGNPFSLESTVSSGIVSGIRNIEEEGGKFLQITAPISPGSSGGPVFNMAGEVVGITTLYLKGGENLNFAIPINDAKRLLSTISKVRNFSGETDLETRDGNANSAPVDTDEIWTSMSSGRDYKLRFDGQYIYADLIFPAGLQGTTPAFVRSEVRKDGSKWTGKIKSFLPCQYQNIWTKQMETKWFSEEVSVELSSVTPTRIEGRNQAYSGGYDCKKGSFKGSLDWKTFTMIPKNPGPSAAVRETASKSSPDTNGTIFMTSNPNGAEIYVDDSFVAKSPTTLNLKPGLHYIRMFMKDYKNWSRQVTVGSGSEASITATLEKSN